MKKLLNETFPIGGVHHKVCHTFDANFGERKNASVQQTPRAAPVGGLTCGRAGLGSGRPHHITTSTSQRGLVGLTGALKPSHPILPSLPPRPPPSAIFSVSFPINITAFI